MDLGEKRMWQIIKFVKQYAKIYKGSIALFILLSVGTWCANIAIPYITGNYIDTLVFVKTKDYVYSFALLVLVVNLINMVISFFGDLLNTKLNSKVAYAISHDLFKHLRFAQISEFENKDSVYLSNRIINDSNNITFFCLNNIVSVLTNLGTLLAAFVILFKVHTPIALGLLPLIPIYAILYFIFRKSLFDTNRKFRETQDEYMGVVSEQFQNIYYIKINVLFHEIALQLRQAYEKLFKRLYKFYRLNYIFSNLGNSILIIANVVLALFGGLAVVNNTLSIGMFSVLNIYFNMIISALSFFLNFAANLQEAKTSYSRLQELYNIHPEHNGKAQIENIDTITINDLSFAYNKSRSFYNHSTIRFEKGNIYCLLGENGAGKSTFINIMVGLYMGKYEGQIYYDNIDIKELDLYHIRRKLISISAQEPILLSNTIYENIVLGVDDVDTQEIEYWCRILNIDETIKKMPNGIHTRLSEKSANISGGEKQKFTHIRSFLKKSNVFIFDEPTSALDKKSTEVLKDILTEQKKDKIIIIITHDQELNSIADYIVTFNDNGITYNKV